MAISRIPVNHLNQRPVSAHMPPNQKPVNNVGAQARPTPPSGLSQTKPTDSVKISPDAMAQVAKSPSTTPSTASDPSVPDTSCACNSPVPDLQQDRHKIQAGRRDIVQDLEDEDDNEEKDEEENVEKTEDKDSNANVHNSQQDQQGLRTDQKDERQEPSHHHKPGDVKETSSALRQGLLSDPKAENILRDLRNLLADFEKI